MNLLPSRRVCGAIFSLSVAAFWIVPGTTLVRADPLVWDSSGANPNAPADGWGNWDTTAGNAVWSNVETAPAGAAQDSVWNNAANNVAVFGNEIAGGMISIDNGNVTASGLTFNDTAGNSSLGYNIVNNGVAGNTLTLSGSSPTITTNANAEIEAVIAGSSGFTKEGIGTLTLSTDESGTGTNTYTGPVTVAAGTMDLIGSAGSTVITGNLTIGSEAAVVTEAANMIASTSQVVVNGTLAIGSGGQPSGESIAGLSGSGLVELSQAPTPALTLNLTQSETFSGTFSGQGSIAINSAQSNVAEILTSTTPFNQAVTVNGGIFSVQALTNLEATLNGGTFRYTGTGGTSGGQLALGPNGGTLDASGTGALTTTGGGQIQTIGSGSRTLTLTGSSTAANTFDIGLEDPVEAPRVW